MAYNILLELEKGNIKHLKSLYESCYNDFKKIPKLIRESNNSKRIIDGFLSKVIDIYPSFCFDIIYDMNEYSKELEYIIKKNYTKELLPKGNLIRLMYNNDALGEKYVKENFDKLIDTYKNDINFILKYLFENIYSFKSELDTLSKNNDLNIRFLFMDYLTINEPDKLNVFYDDITKYLTSYSYNENEQLTLFVEKMSAKNVAKIAYNIFENCNDKSAWNKIKEYIYENFDENDLGYRLLSDKEVIIDNFKYNIENKNGIIEFSKDADRLFKTSSKKLYILNNYAALISRKLISDYKKKLKYFVVDGKLDSHYKRIDEYGLTKKVEEYIDKYLSMSKDSSYNYIASGSTTTCFKIGDYVFKLAWAKWSYEDIICPDLYIILPNLEENFIRNEDGVIMAGVEVQKYLPLSAKDVPSAVFNYYLKELNDLGYYTTDTLVGGSCGDNLRLLNNYIDSGNLNPPEWFKEYPLVMVDRDRVYKLENEHPKQLRSKY